MPDLVDNPDMRRFELPLGDDIAAVYYRDEGDFIILTHTEVPYAFTGAGIGSMLAKLVFDEIRRRGRKAIVKCPFLSMVATRDGRYADVIAG